MNVGSDDESDIGIIERKLVKVGAIVTQRRGDKRQTVTEVKISLNPREEK